jgi:hypothetical protein
MAHCRALAHPHLNPLSRKFKIYFILLIIIIVRPKTNKEKITKEFLIHELLLLLLLLSFRRLFAALTAIDCCRPFF